MFVTVIAQFTAKTTDSEKAIYVLSLMFYWINKVKSHILFTRKNFIFSNFTWRKAAHNLRKSKFRISIRGLLLQNNFLTKSGKSLQIMSLFKSKVKNKLLVLENEAKYFEQISDSFK